MIGFDLILLDVGPLASLSPVPFTKYQGFGTRCPSVRRGGAPSTELRRHRATRVALDFRFYFPLTQGGSSHFVFCSEHLAGEGGAGGREW